MNVIPFPGARERVLRLASQDGEVVPAAQPVIKAGGASKTKGAAKRGPARNRDAALSAQEIARRLNEIHDEHGIDFASIYHLSEGAANTSNDDSVVATGGAELALRRLIAKYGFERLPFTYGELNGLIEYCEDLQSYAHPVYLSGEALESWRRASRKVVARYYPAMLTALDLYTAGDLEALRALHLREKTLERLGREYRPETEQEGE